MMRSHNHNTGGSGSLRFNIVVNIDGQSMEKIGGDHIANHKGTFGGELLAAIFQGAMSAFTHPVG